jgi:CpeT protein
MLSDRVTLLPSINFFHGSFDMSQRIRAGLLVLVVMCVMPAFQPARAGDLEDLVEMLTGSFSSQAQALEDSLNFWDIRLEMTPIWTDRGDGPWLYVEQAAAAKLDKPYRQRVYRVTRAGDNLFESAVFSLPDPEAVIGAWAQPAMLDQWTPDDLEVRQGCSVFLTRAADGSFQGSTRDKECTSNLRGAVYATSEIVLETDRIVSWDRGFDADDQQVWGAEKGGYVFLKDLGPGAPQGLETR